MNYNPEVKTGVIIANKTDSNQGNKINQPLSISNFHKPLPVTSLQSGESEVKKLLNTEYEKVKSSIAKLEDNFNKENFLLLTTLLKNYCNKNVKNLNKNLKVKGNLYKTKNNISCKPIFRRQL